MRNNADTALRHLMGWLFCRSLVGARGPLDRCSSRSHWRQKGTSATTATAAKESELRRCFLFPSYCIGLRCNNNRTATAALAIRSPASDALLQLVSCWCPSVNSWILPSHAALVGSRVTRTNVARDAPGSAFFTTHLRNATRRDSEPGAPLPSVTMHSPKRGCF